MTGVALHALRVILCLMALAWLSACAQLQYVQQAALGQAEVLEHARPITEVIDDPATPPALVEKLKLAQRLRAFAISELKLPNNASYTRYADLGRPYVVWNVVSTPALSMTPIQSCFPLAGCFAYRGYYSEAEATAWANAQEKAGLDVFLYGVPAYSTLGWFADPLLNSTAQYGETSLARLIFHELAHQVVYVKGDSNFNEAFATSVELEGIDRWLAFRDDAKLTAAYRAAEKRQQAFDSLMQASKSKLLALYQSDTPNDAKVAEKARIQADLLEQYQQLKASWNGYAGYDQWFDPVPNNAHFASLSTYHGLVPAFQQLMRENKGDMPAFFNAVKALADKTREDRNKDMAALSAAAVAWENQAIQGDASVGTASSIR